MAIKKIQELVEINEWHELTGNTVRSHIVPVDLSIDTCTSHTNATPLPHTVRIREHNSSVLLSNKDGMVFESSAFGEGIVDFRLSSLLLKSYTGSMFRMATTGSERPLGPRTDFIVDWRPPLLLLFLPVVDSLDDGARSWNLIAPSEQPYTNTEVDIARGAEVGIHCPPPPATAAAFFAPPDDAELELRWPSRQHRIVHFAPRSARRRRTRARVNCNPRHSPRPIVNVDDGAVAITLAAMSSSTSKRMSFAVLMIPSSISSSIVTVRSMSDTAPLPRRVSQCIAFESKNVKEVSIPTDGSDDDD